MHRLVISLLFLLCSVGFTQEQKFEIHGWGGLDTRSSVFTISPTSLLRALNVDLSRNGDSSLSKRYGYDSISVLGGMDSLIALFGAYYADGSQQLFVVADSAGVGYGGVYISAKGSADISSATKIRDFFPITGDVSLAMYNDDIYGTSSVGPGFVYNGRSAYSFPLTPPGGLTLTPLATSGSNDGVDGEVYYAYSWDYPGVDDTINSVGRLNGPVKVKDGQVHIAGFSLRTQDSLYAGPDTARIKLWRTTGDVGKIDRLDTLWYTGWTIKIDSSDWTTASIIDTISDDSLRNSATFRYVIAEDTSVWNGEKSHMYTERRHGFYVNGAADADKWGHAPGAIGYVDNSTRADSGIWKGCLKSDALAWYYVGWSYMVSFGDSVSNQLSDTALTFNYLVRSDQVALTDYAEIRLALPRLVDTGLVAKVWRSRWQYNLDQIEVNGTISQHYRPEQYYLIGTFSPGDTITDTMSWDTVLTKDQFPGTYVPPYLSQIFTNDDRLFGFHESSLYFSRLDTAVFGVFNEISLNKSDGQEITAAYPSRLGITALKNKSRFSVYQDANLNWNRKYINGFVGCIAPYSYAASPLGVYVLSERGVRRSTDGITLDRTYQDRLVSGQLDNFDKLPLTTRAKAKAFYFDQKYMLSIGDSVYVYDERVDGWSIWRGITFQDATYYGVEDVLGFYPGDTMYFIRPGDSLLYRYGTSEYDNGAYFDMDWETAPLLVSSHYKRITKLGLWVTSTDTTTETVRAYIYNESKVLGTPYVGFPALNSGRYIKEAFTGEPATDLYYTIYFASYKPVGWTGFSPTVIDGLDIYWITIGESETD